MKRPYHRTELSRVKVKAYHQDDGPTELQPKTAADKFAGPNSYATVAHVTDDPDMDAKLTQRVTSGNPQQRAYFDARIHSNLTVDEDPDVPEAWNGYVSDN